MINVEDLTKDYERINKEDILYIEIWKDSLRIHLINKEVLDLDIYQEEDK